MCMRGRVDQPPFKANGQAGRPAVSRGWFVRPLSPRMPIYNQASPTTDAFEQQLPFSFLSTTSACQLPPSFLQQQLPASLLLAAFKSSCLPASSQQELPAGLLPTRLTSR